MRELWAENETPRMAKGTVAAPAPASATAKLLVVIPSFDGGRLEWEMITWMPRPGPSGPLFPEEDDDVLVGFDEDGEPHALTWKPSA